MADEETTKLYKNIQFLRETKQIKSIRQLEFLAGITQDSIKTWKNRLPNCESVIKLAEYFNVSVDFIMGLNSIPKPESICDKPNLGKILYVASHLDLGDYETDVVIKMMHVLAETGKMAEKTI